MRTNNTILAMTACLIGIAVAPAASAQSFLMRQKLMPGSDQPAPKTYVATYSTTYGACSNGVQTAPIASCKDEGGKNVDVSLCGVDAQQSAPRSCSSYYCTSFVAKTTVSGAYVILGKEVYTDSAADTLCTKHANSNNVAGVCNRETSGQYLVYFYKDRNTSHYRTESYLSSRASTCFRQ